MNTKKRQFESHNSPWTEVYDRFCEQDTTASQAAATPAQKEEQAPTQEALASVYSRLDTSRERF